ncbi:MAG: signal peptidase II [Elusimicrobiaceae bacterium]|nr:signal peptidase II [Elusimicrobiaceae bacterium]
MRNLWKKVCQGYWNNACTIGAVAFVFLLDRFTKLAALFWLQDSPIEVFPFFHLRYVENTGAAFGMMQNGNLWLIFIMIGIVVYLLKSWKELCSYGKIVEWGCIFILAGALGNLYDRITLGFVVDFLDFRVWPVFNVADSFITIGACLFVISLFIGKKGQGEEK